ncbi:MAG: hypothetical protein V5A81_07860 [Candidatus Bipolaricaulota bacterium]|nr:hypothetical protein [Candidatus Bipolaricaulota bacterium]MBS3792592.1 hypothetical protein [Candidatus Bipolaricaulota bacterium]
MKQGIEEGTLYTELPGEASRLILHMGTNLQEEMSEVLLDDEAEVEAKKFTSKYKAYENAIERVVVAPEGSIGLMEEADLERFLTCFDRGNSVEDL